MISKFVTFAPRFNQIYCLTNPKTKIKMKKVTFLLATLLIGGMMLTGCQKDPQPTPTPDTPTPTPTPTTKTVVYKMDNVYYEETSSTPLSPGFHFVFKYKDADGTMVEVNDPTLPWTKEISVTTPFEAKLEGKMTFNENELPEEGKVCVGALCTIKTNNNTTPIPHCRLFRDKQQFLDFLSTHPDMLDFTFNLSIN
jgi:ABC-type transport system substrate-binding protein